MAYGSYYGTYFGMDTTTGGHHLSTFSTYFAGYLGLGSSYTGSYYGSPYYSYSGSYYRSAYYGSGSSYGSAGSYYGYYLYGSSY